jgi:hypothetical protein
LFHDTSLERSMTLNRRVSVCSFILALVNCDFFFFQKCIYTERGFELTHWYPCDLERVLENVLYSLEVAFTGNTVRLPLKNRAHFHNFWTHIHRWVSIYGHSVRLWSVICSRIFVQSKMTFRRSPLPVSRWGNTGVLECATFISFCLSVALGIFVYGIFTVPLAAFNASELHECPQASIRIYPQLPIDAFFRCITFFHYM